jgi:hypothetical protein
MQRLIRDYALKQPLSEKEILQLVEGKARVVTHPEIKSYKIIERLLGKHEACIILYVTHILEDGSVYGHWCCVFRAPWAQKTISFFDPYGNPPDNAISHMGNEAIEEYGQEKDLSNLLNDWIRRGGHVVYNIAPLQQREAGNAICGRLTGLRLQFKQLDGNQFAELMTSYPHLSSDDLATLLTSFIR